MATLPLNDDLPPPGSLLLWAKHWQREAALLSVAAREWRLRDATIANTYDETACTYYKRARHLVQALANLERIGK